MRILKYLLPAFLLISNISCCRTSCLNMIPVNPIALSTGIMVEKMEFTIEASINYYCEKNKWPSSKNDIADYRTDKGKVNIGDFRKIEFNKQGDKRLNINFDISAFDYKTFRVEKYAGFCDIFIQDDTQCADNNKVELYVSDFVIYNKNYADKKPIKIPIPIIIRFDNFKNRTITSIQQGYET